MQSAISVAGDVATLGGTEQSPRAAPAWFGDDARSSAAAISGEDALIKLEQCATELEKLQRSHRIETLGAVANGTLTVDAAMVRVDTLRSLQALAYHAWRSAAHLVGRGD
jgi:phosphate:Na+ symporter